MKQQVCKHGTLPTTTQVRPTCSQHNSNSSGDHNGIYGHDDGVTDTSCEHKRQAMEQLASSHGTSTITGSTGTAGSTNLNHVHGWAAPSLSYRLPRPGVERMSKITNKCRIFNDQMHTDATAQMAKLQLADERHTGSSGGTTSDNNPTVTMNKGKASAKEKKQMDAAILQDAKNTVAKAKTAVNSAQVSTCRSYGREFIYHSPANAEHQERKQHCRRE